MPKKYTMDPNSEFFDEDDMPCPCRCGNWFDLNDGYPDQDEGSNTLVCQECHENQETDRLIDMEIEDAEEDEDWDDEDESPMSRLQDEGFD